MARGEILEAYFNLAPYGGNIEGVGAAARIYFRTTSGRLTRTESLALAVVPQNPVRRSPLNGPDFEAARARMQMLADARRRSGRWAGGDCFFWRVGFRLGEGPAAAPWCMVRRGCRSGLRTFRARRFRCRGVGSLCAPVSTAGLQRLMERAVAGFAARGRRYGLNNAGGAAHPLAEHGDPGARGVGRFF
ncbi:transglycosylase domain-containing protein [Bilophila wadsworthia]|uniref:transglycosylase domain-containing protein n=1 Tax=Bilophila wadsworthia TaxID=35833 RepID=UPI003522FDEE